MALNLSSKEVECFEPSVYYDHFIQQGIRPNGRLVEELRPISLSLSPLRSVRTVGSAFANVGSTRVLCTATLQVGTPDLAAPNEGDLVVKMSASSIFSNSLNPRLKTERSQQISEFIQSTLLSSGAILLSDLIISEFKSAWQLTLELLCINDDGCLEDACLSATMATVKSLRLPSTVIDDQGMVGIVSDNTKSMELPVHVVLSSLSCCIWYPPKENLDIDMPLMASSQPLVVADPDYEEESLLNTSVTIVYDASNPVEPVLCGVRTHRGSVSPEIISKCMKLTANRCTQHARVL